MNTTSNARPIIDINRNAVHRRASPDELRAKKVTMKSGRLAGINSVVERVLCWPWMPKSNSSNNKGLKNYPSPCTSKQINAETSAFDINEDRFMHAQPSRHRHDLLTPNSKAAPYKEIPYPELVGAFEEYRSVVALIRSRNYSELITNVPAGPQRSILGSHVNQVTKPNLFRTYLQAQEKNVNSGWRHHGFSLISPVNVPTPTRNLLSTPQEKTDSIVGNQPRDYEVTSTKTLKSVSLDNIGISNTQPLTGNMLMNQQATSSNGARADNIVQNQDIASKENDKSIKDTSTTTNFNLVTSTAKVRAAKRPRDEFSYDEFGNPISKLDQLQLDSEDKCPFKKQKLE